MTIEQKLLGSTWDELLKPDDSRERFAKILSDVLNNANNERIKMVDPTCKKCGMKMIPGYGFDFDPTECNDCAPEIWEQYVEKLRSLPKEQTENLASHGRGLSWLIGTTYTQLRAREDADSQSAVNVSRPLDLQQGFELIEEPGRVTIKGRVMLGDAEYDFVEFGEKPKTNESKH